MWPPHLETKDCFHCSRCSSSYVFRTVWPSPLQQGAAVTCFHIKLPSKWTRSWDWSDESAGWVGVNPRSHRDAFHHVEAQHIYILFFTHLTHVDSQRAHQWRNSISRPSSFQATSSRKQNVTPEWTRRGEEQAREIRKIKVNTGEETAAGIS